tara:strand:+ start:615 stop:824 length:210 start_codon:yes stop_codon:yes gene_type:complete
MDFHKSFGLWQEFLEECDTLEDHKWEVVRLPSHPTQEHINKVRDELFMKNAPLTQIVKRHRFRFNKANT